MITVELLRDNDHGDLHCPIIYCDACGQRITGHGNAYWLNLDTGDMHPGVWHVHKACANYDRLLENHYGGLVLFEELDEWLEQLRHNLTSEAR